MDSLGNVMVQPMKSGRGEERCGAEGDTQDIYERCASHCIGDEVVGVRMVGLARIRRVRRVLG